MMTEQKIAQAIDMAFQSAHDQAVKGDPVLDMEVCHDTLRGLGSVLSSVRESIANAEAALTGMEKYRDLIDRLAETHVSVEMENGEWLEFDGSSLSTPLARLKDAIANVRETLQDADFSYEDARHDMNAIYGEE